MTRSRGSSKARAANEPELRTQEKRVAVRLIPLTDAQCVPKVCDPLFGMFRISGRIGRGIKSTAQLDRKGHRALSRDGCVAQRCCRENEERK